MLEIIANIHPPKPTKLLPPENLTVRWIIDHLTIGGWTKLIVIAGVIFSAGLAVGASTIMQKLLGRWLGL